MADASAAKVCERLGIPCGWAFQKTVSYGKKDPRGVSITPCARRGRGCVFHADAIRRYDFHQPGLADLIADLLAV